jgi:O-antigen/teichoic acid export membrane protein
MRYSWLDAMTPVQAAIFTVVASALVYLLLVYVLHWATNIVYYAGMTVAVGFLNVRRAWIERRRQDTFKRMYPD